MTKELNLTQKDELIEQYVELVVYNMDVKSMMQFITDTLKDEYNDYSDDELKCQIECTHDEELYDELVDNVTNEDDDEELTTQEQEDYINSNLTEETFIDINNTGGKF